VRRRRRLNEVILRQIDGARLPVHDWLSPQSSRARRYARPDGRPLALVSRALFEVQSGLTELRRSGRDAADCAGPPSRAWEVFLHGAGALPAKHSSHRRAGAAAILISGRVI
jgi:hypothetical protein